MTDHKAIREALAAGPTEGPFITFGDQVYRSTDPDLSHPLASWNTCQFTMEGVSIDALYYAACNPSAIRALLSDLDDSHKAYGLLFSEYSRLREKLEQATSAASPGRSCPAPTEPHQGQTTSDAGLESSAG